MQSNRLNIVVTALIGIAAFALAGIIVARFNDSASAEGITVAENGTTVAVDLSQQDALAEASQRVGFNVKAPKKLPDPRLQLTSISVQLTSPKIPNPFNTATLKWSPRDKPGGPSSYYIEIVQIGHRIAAPEDVARLIPTSQREIEVWVEENDYGVHGYTAFVAGRTYLVLVYGAKDGPTESAILDSIFSLK